MALSRQLSVFTWKSSSGGKDYFFDVAVDVQGLVSVRNIRTSQGAIDAGTDIPESVMDDIETAKAIVRQLVGETNTASGTVTFTGQLSRAVTIPVGILNNADYRVVYTTSDGVVLTTESKTATGFTVVAPFTYGTVPAPKTVGWVVLVKTQQASVCGGTLTFEFADGGQKAVSFSPAFTTVNYRVVLSELGFFKARVISQTKGGFIVELGHTLAVGDTVNVGYDVFVS